MGHIICSSSEQIYRVSGSGETYSDLLADATDYEAFDAEQYFGGKGFGFVRLNQLALEHMMRAR